MAERVCGKALEIHGAVGYSKDLPLEKYYRDAKAMAIFEGANQVQRIISARCSEDRLPCRPDRARSSRSTP